MLRFVLNSLCIALLVTIVSLLYAQMTIKGVVKTSRSKPIPGVSISLKDSYDGATSDSSGRFSFTTTEKGEMTLVATAIGFKMHEQPVKLEANIDSLVIVLKEEVTELEAVTLSAGTFEASDRKRAAAVLDPIDIVTTASANGDITG